MLVDSKAFVFDDLHRMLGKAFPGNIVYNDGGALYSVFQTVMWTA